MVGITRTLSDFVAKTTFDSLPDDVVHKIKQVILDAVGCALAGHVIDRARIAMELVKDSGGRSQASIIGGRKTSWALAAFANSELINSLDYDPLGPLIAHVCPYVLPPALAMAERANASGKELITSLALGHEIGGRVATSVSQLRVPKEEPPFAEESPRFSFTTQIFGAVASACKSLRLDSERTANAFGIGGASTPVPAGVKWLRTSGPQPMAKYGCWPGWVAQLATVATLAAERGFTGDTTILDGDYGFWKIYGSPFFKPENITAKLGQIWHMDRVHFKPYPSCGLNHSSIDGINKIMVDNAIRPEDIESIVVKAGDPMLLVPARTGLCVESSDDCAFRSTYILAVAVYNGRNPSPGWQLPATFNDPKIRELMKKIKVELHPQAAEFARSQVGPGGVPPIRNVNLEVTAGGRRFTTEVARKKGDPSNPLSDDELKDKFRNNASYLPLRSHKIEKIIEMIYRLEEIDDITALTRILRVNS